MPRHAFATAPTWTAYDAGTDYSSPEGVQIRFNSSTNEFGFLYFQNGATCCTSDGYFRLFFSTSTDGSSLSSRTTVETIDTNVWAMQESASNLAVSETGQYVYLRPSVTRGVSDGSYFGQRQSDGTWVNYSPSGLSNAFGRGTLLDASGGVYAFATEYQDQENSANRKIIFATSNDNGITFTPVTVASDLSAQASEADLLKTASGYAIVWLSEDAKIHITFSTNNGATWSTPIDHVASTLPLAMISSISSAVDTSGNIWVAYPIASGSDVGAISVELRLLKFPSGGTEWNSPESIDNVLADGITSWNPAWTSIQAAGLQLVNGTTPIIGYYKLGSQAGLSKPGSINYALREPGTGCSGTDGTNFRCGIIDSTLTETINSFDSGFAAPMGMAVHGSRVVVGYPQIGDNARFRVAYTDVTLDASSSTPTSTSGGGIPEFSTYVYIATMCGGLIFLIKKSESWKSL